MPKRSFLSGRSISEVFEFTRADEVKKSGLYPISDQLRKIEIGCTDRRQKDDHGRFKQLPWLNSPS
jgi:hypothetical protein